MEASRLAEITRDYWLVCLQDRRRLNVDKLDRKEWSRMALSHRMRRSLIEQINLMPGRLAQCVIDQSRSWQINIMGD